MHIKVIALDLEGTLISNAMSQIPRPGLLHFLNGCKQLVDRVVMYTTVSEPIFREIARRLVVEGYAPDWFREIEYITREGETKNLAKIPGCQPEEALLVDDFDIYVHPGQEAQWIKVPYFDVPYPADDTGLSIALDMIREKVLLSRPLSILQETFAKMLSHFGHQLPEDDVLHRRRGRIGDENDGDYGHGDVVTYLFGQDARGEYLDFYMCHRFAGDQHIRIYEDGSWERLDVISPFGPRVSDDPVENERWRREDQEEVARIRAILDAKGLSSSY
jgi:hypothetical protein